MTFTFGLIVGWLSALLWCWLRPRALAYVREWREDRADARTMREAREEQGDEPPEDWEDVRRELGDGGRDP